MRKLMMSGLIVSTLISSMIYLVINKPEFEVTILSILSTFIFLYGINMFWEFVEEFAKGKQGEQDG